MTKIAIIGLGYVGGAIKASMVDKTPAVDLVLIDPFKGETGTYTDLENCDGVFVCVPTPQSDDGTCDTEPLKSVLSQLLNVKFQGVIISKCTAPPDVYAELNRQFPNLVHAPEFLTAANAVKDYANGTFSIIGGSSNYHMLQAEKIIRIGQTGLTNNVKFCTIGEASLAKYTINTFLATKVIFMNEIHQIAEKSGLSYDSIADMLGMDSRIGASHLKVPGPDGSYGFGGACFPKDTSALLKYCEGLGITPAVLAAAVKKNKQIR
jgi:UDPglucose 6-dehydrogenase